MREMKDSGVEWIGEIPSNWNRSRLGYVCDEFIVPMRDKPQKFDGDIPWCRIEDIEGKYINGTKSNQYVSQDTVDELNLKVYPIGTIINSCSATIGVSAIVTRPLCTNQTFIGLVAGNEINNTYLFWLMNALGDYQKFTGHGSTITYISQDKYRKMDIPLPDKNEQKRIADYLDAKCAKIDSIIEKQQAIIEKLKEYKLSVITEAVTKGLNSDVEMKDSGVEWIGKMPLSWNIARIKYNYYLKGRIGWQGLKADEFIEAGPYLVTGTDFENGKVNWNTCYHISQERYDEAPEIHVEIGDLLITKDGTVGKVAYIDEKPDQVSLNSHLLIMRPLNNNYSNRFLFWTIQSSVFKKFFGLTQNGTIMASLSQEKINDFVYVMPDIDEQEKIANYLDNKCSEVENCIAIKSRVIEKLREYKKSLIYEVITGKKEV